MSLSAAIGPDGSPLEPGPAPLSCLDLMSRVGVDFTLPCEDPWLLQREGPAAAYLDAAERQWTAHPEYMDFLAMDSPVFDLKRAERDLYLHHWGPWLRATRVLDVGCGIGRMSLPFLDRGATVVGVDGDLQSLRCFAGHAAGRAGRLDLRWTSASALPEEGDFDVIIACEVLCYLPEAAAALRAMAERLRPGGALLLSWEAPYGWATAEDAPADAIEQALRGAGVIDLPGDRWVRTVTEVELRALLTDAGLEVGDVAPTHYTIDGPLERCLGDELSLEALLQTEAACRAHPVWRPLNRIWTAVAHRPRQAMRASEEA